MAHLTEKKEVDYMFCYNFYMPKWIHQLNNVGKHMRRPTMFVHEGQTL